MSWNITNLFNSGTPVRPGVATSSPPTHGEGEMVALSYDLNGNLRVSATGATGGTSSTDEDTFTAGVSLGTPAMGVVNPSDTPADGKLAIYALDSARNVKVNIAAGSITVAPVTSNAVSAVTSPATIGTSPVAVLAANPSRKRFTLQNVGTSRLWVLFGAGTVSSSNYVVSLPAGGSTNDGSSPVWQDTMWQGSVNVISSAAGGSLAVAEFI